MQGGDTPAATPAASPVPPPTPTPLPTPTPSRSSGGGEEDRALVPPVTPVTPGPSSAASLAGISIRAATPERLIQLTVNAFSKCKALSSSVG
jgi:hypothetical protein